MGFLCSIRRLVHLKVKEPALANLQGAFKEYVALRAGCPVPASDGKLSADGLSLDSTKALYKHWQPFVRKCSMSSHPCIAALQAWLAKHKEEQDKKDREEKEEKEKAKEAATQEAGGQPSAGSDQAASSKHNEELKAQFEIHDVVTISVQRNKAKYDTQKGMITKLNASEAMVELITGPEKGNPKAFKYANLIPQPKKGEKRPCAESPAEEHPIEKAPRPEPADETSRVFGSSLDLRGC